MPKPARGKRGGRAALRGGEDISRSWEFLNEGGGPIFGVEGDEFAAGLVYLFSSLIFELGSRIVKETDCLCIIAFGARNETSMVLKPEMHPRSQSEVRVFPT